MEERAVVTCFLRHEGQILLFRRSEAVSTYPGRWGTVTGYLTPDRGADPDDPGTAARQEIREETALDAAVTLVRAGDPFVVEDADRGIRWRIHPFLFDIERREIDPNWETDEWEWVHPPEIRRRETVPDLWRSYDAVRPTVETVATDREHGSAWLSIRALEVLRDEAAVAKGRDSVAAVARELRAARPSMTVLANRINRVMSSAGGCPDAVEQAVTDGIREAVTADREAAAVAADRITGKRVCTFSRSGTVLTAIQEGEPEAVLVSEARPGREGIGVAEQLAGDHDLTLTSDAALASQLAEWGADVVLVGADTILADGSVLNKVGTFGLALAAARESVPVSVAAGTDKVAPEDDVTVEPSPVSLYEGDAPLAVENPLFDVTPADLIAGLCTEAGLLDDAAVKSVADRHRRNRGW